MKECREEYKKLTNLFNACDVGTVWDEKKCFLKQIFLC